MSDDDRAILSRAAAQVDAVGLRPVAVSVVSAGGLYATHEGVMELLGRRIRVYQLNDGNRVLDADDVEAFFGFVVGRPDDEGE